LFLIYPNDKNKILIYKKDQMPSPKIYMQISNGNLYSSVVSPVSPVSKPSSTTTLSLSSSMIQRIHNVRPGCGSCGK